MSRAGHNPRRKRWVGALILALLCAAIAAGVTYYLTFANPSWWREVKTSDPGVGQAAEQVENGVIAQASLARPADPQHPQHPGGAAYQSQPWSVSISAEDADAWLGTRLKQ